MQSFTHFPPRGRTEPPETNRPDPSVVPGAASLSRGVSIKGSVKFLNELLLDGEVEGTPEAVTDLVTIHQPQLPGDNKTRIVPDEKHVYRLQARLRAKAAVSLSPHVELAWEPDCSPEALNPCRLRP